MSRPKITEEIKLTAAEKISSELNHDHSECRAADIADCYTHGMDGYELAKTLERRCYWTIEMDMLDILDSMGTEVHDAHNKICWAWVKDNNVQPPLPIGSMTTIGEITGVYESLPAHYLIITPEQAASDDENKSRRIVKFEDAKAA